MEASTTTKGPVSHLTFLLGGVSELPCQINRSVDSPKLILWYKEGILKPIYSFDARDPSSPIHWSNREVLDSRAYYDSTKSSLKLQKTTTSDEGLYRCRVEFWFLPTQTSVIKLSVTVPPYRLYITDDKDSEVPQVIGPFVEGDSIVLTCHALGGDPAPRVTWWNGNYFLEDQVETVKRDEVISKVVLKGLRREDLHKSVQCNAQNYNSSSAVLQTSATIDMNFPAATIKIMGAREPLSANNNYKIVCQALGARPAAEIRWFLDGDEVEAYSNEIKNDGSQTISGVMLRVTSGENGKLLSCKSEFQYLAKSSKIEDVLPLNVYYAPEVNLVPGGSLNLSDIEEGDDVYFECKVNANPPAFKFVWFFEESEVRHNVSLGIIQSEHSLALQKVSRYSTGNYRCRASNVEGDTVSNNLLLRVKYAPVCSTPNQASRYGVSPGETANVTCRLDAFPASTSFVWTFNNSGGVTMLLSKEPQLLLTQSENVLRYTPKSDLDYGTLLCWGSNSVGRQRNPCIFSVFMAGPPDPVANCTLFNLSTSSINVRCFPGFDGGLRQYFVLEIRDGVNGRSVATVNNTEPLFLINGMRAGQTFNALLYAVNGKGRGLSTSFRVYTTTSDAAETAAIMPAPSSSETLLGSAAGIFLPPFVAILLGIAFGVIFVVLIILVALRCRRVSRYRLGLVGKAECGDPTRVTHSNSLYSKTRTEDTAFLEECQNGTGEELEDADECISDDGQKKENAAAEGGRTAKKVTLKSLLQNSQEIVSESKDGGCDSPPSVAGLCRWKKKSLVAKLSGRCKEPLRNVGTKPEDKRGFSSSRNRVPNIDLLPSTADRGEWSTAEKDCPRNKSFFEIDEHLLLSQQESSV